MPMRSIREIPEGTRDFLFRVVVVPFEVATALVAIWSGFAGLLGLSQAANAFNATLPSWLVVLFNILYLVAGTGVLAGVGWNYKNAEASGLILLITSLLVRAIALYFAIGLTSITINVIIQGIFFGGASLVRLLTILAKHTTVLMATDHDAVVIESIEDLKGES